MSHPPNTPFDSRPRLPPCRRHITHLPTGNYFSIHRTSIAPPTYVVNHHRLVDQDFIGLHGAGGKSEVWPPPRSMVFCEVRCAAARGDHTGDL
ncbi:hypothetical protein E2C01_023791 [Portunus trituberculatus]|uniref:Uncharacterized protein n=1 Tax=Portunus trituberculatus TaxID=210409 RepID=A0A5B7EC31_PORTR|nr:hypothetical protein [Portunus trituberculatus]